MTLISLSPIAHARLDALLDEQRARPMSYPEASIGATDGGDAPAGFTLDHNRQLLGRGAEVFAAASAALRAWTMFPAPWTQIYPHAPVIAKDQVVAVQIRVMGLWWTGAARIAYTIDEPRRAGFAYGTLPAHAERGEERFSVEWAADDEVWFDLRAFSRPRMLLAWLGYPVTRAYQRKFQRESKAAMLRACAP